MGPSSRTATALSVTSMALGELPRAELLREPTDNPER